MSGLFCSIGLHVWVWVKSAHACTVTIYEWHHLGLIWCHASTSWQRLARLSFSCFLNACEPDWVGECVGVCMFSSNSVLVWNRFYFATPSLTVCLSRELPALFLNLTITQCQHLPSWLPSPLLSCFSFPHGSLKWDGRTQWGVFICSIWLVLWLVYFFIYFFCCASSKFDHHCQIYYFLKCQLKLW